MSEEKILIIDDDDNTRNAYKDLFLGYGFQTQATESDTWALELLRKDNHQAVLLDLRVSNEKLISIAEGIKKEFPRTYVSIMLVDLTPATFKKAMDGGIDECMVKPLLPMQLIASLKKGVLRYTLERENQDLMQKIKELEEQNRQWLIHDIQTGVYNSHYFSERLDLEVKRAKRHEHWLSVLLCDLIHSENEDPGASIPPPEGTLRVVKGISKSLRDIDIVARYKNGFGIILPETSPEGSSTLCNRLKNHIADLLDFNENEPNPGHEQKPNIRFGIATYPFDTHLPKKLLKIAEERLQ
ncbi:MAG: diguanylate cyclase domain-containing protein [bacterium]